MDKLATKDELIQLIAGRDQLVNTQLADLRDDIKTLTRALETERHERKSGDKDNEDRSNRARNFAMTAIGLVVTVVLGLLALINQVRGIPS